MDYLKIVLEGYCNKSNREHLADYFFSVFKQAETKQNCSADLFMAGCMEVIDALNMDLRNSLNELKSQQNKYLMINEPKKDITESFREQIKFQELNGNTNFRVATGAVLRITKDEIKYIENELKKAYSQIELPLRQNETKTEQDTFVIKPVLKPEAVQTVFDILKDFFSTEQQNELKQVLETGNNTNNPLIFLDNGNRLADAFKQLKKADIITGCEQKELENWIGKNFKYRYRQVIKEYTPRYLNDIISTNKVKCQSPLLNVRIEKATGEKIITKA